MGSIRLPKAKRIPALKQAFVVCSRFDTFNFKVYRPNHVLIKGVLQPTSFSPKYTIEINYKFGKYPIVKIIEPEIIEFTPHTFSKNKICTFYPSTENWSSTQYLSETLIPWICDWINYYELYLVTGEWHGEPHPKHKSIRRECA